MLKVLLFFDTPLSQSDGIYSHCKALLRLFKDSPAISLEEAKPIERKYSFFLRRYYYPHFKALYRYLKEEPSEIIHVHGLASFCSIQVVIAAKLAKKKVVFSPHYHPFDKMNHPLMMKLYWMFFLKFMLSRIDAIVTINSEDTDFFERIHNCVIMVPHWLFSRGENCKQYVKKKNMLLFVGRNDSNKRLDMLYDLPDNVYEIHCVTNGNVLRKDFIVHSNISEEELIQLYERASLLVVPSRYEAFSLVALEALWYGTPVVVSDRVRIVDHLKDCKIGYAVFPYDDKSVFYEMINKNMGIPVDTEFIRDYFSEEKIRDKYTSLYLSI